MQYIHSAFAFIPIPGPPCAIEPSEGQSLKTIFNINCNGWNSSSSSPLRYEFWYTLQSGLHGLLYKGNMSSFQTVLIHAISTVRALISDDNGTAVDKELNVSVRNQNNYFDICRSHKDK